MQRTCSVSAVDPWELARTLGVPYGDVAVRLQVTRDYARLLARDYRHAARVRAVVLELALERERLAQVLL